MRTSTCQKQTYQNIKVDSLGTNNLEESAGRVDGWPSRNFLLLVAWFWKQLWLLLNLINRSTSLVHKCTPVWAFSMFFLFLMWCKVKLAEVCWGVLLLSFQIELSLAVPFALTRFWDKKKKKRAAETVLVTNKPSETLPPVFKHPPTPTSELR